MDFDMTAEQEMLKESAQEFFSRELNSEMIREMETDEKGYSPEIWEKISRIGWMGLLVPEAYDGAEMGLLDMAVLLEEMGSAAFTSPFLSTAVVSVLTLLEAGSESQREKLLPGISAGKKIMTLGWNEKGVETSGKAIAAKGDLQGDQYVLNGTKMFVPYAHVADHIITAVRTGDAGDSGEDGISLFIVDRKCPGLGIDMIDVMAGDKQCELSFKDVRVSAEDMLGEENQGWAVLKNVFRKAAVAQCAEMVGGARRVLEMTVEYAKKRLQFGQPIGQFQAIQHHCAKMLTYMETSEMMTYQACWMIDQGQDYEKHASMCKAWVSESYRKLVALGHQVMGGFGFMEEVDHQLYYRRAKTGEILFGDATYHRELVAHKMEL
jgi:alkylation response protein AidB-like acyl-CoA dehydrogenase